jgi:cell wall-associated NlpC family hydrolase
MNIDSVIRITAVLGLTTTAALAGESAERATLACWATQPSMPSSAWVDDAWIRAVEAPLTTESADEEAPNFSSEAKSAPSDLRRVVAEFALGLRHVRYRRGGHAPSTGFDCSGFVHYVFAAVLGIDLPTDAASQFAGGRRLAREDLDIGDLVFFHTRGKRVSHVGIYLGEGRFIHAPASGERVRVDRLDAAYWAHRFIGARRVATLG